MGNKTLISLILILCFSHVNLFSEAVPTSRSLKFFKGEVPVKSLLAQGDLTMRNEQAQSNEEDLLFTKRRMELEETDYPGTGANNHHDPNAPGTV